MTHDRRTIKIKQLECKLQTSRNGIIDLIDCLADCADKGSRPVLSYWIKKYARLLEDITP